MTIIFDGKAFAENKLRDLRSKTFDVRKKGIIPKLVSILVGDDPASKLYVNLKKKAAERIGAQLDVRSMMSDVRKDEILDLVKTLNIDKSVHGIMIQLPLPSKFTLEDRDEIISSIDKDKDVDGLREDSPYLTPTVKAVLEVVKEASALPLRVRPYKVVVVGARGFEGKKIFNVLKEMGYNVIGVDRDTENFEKVTRAADVLISVTGSPDIISSDMVKDGVVVIDVGSPKGDVARNVYEKCAFISPVPGGVGPVTIACLLENLAEAAGVKK